MHYTIKYVQNEIQLDWPTGRPVDLLLLEHIESEHKEMEQNVFM
jgi:hypothetical protein